MKINSVSLWRAIESGKRAFAGLALALACFLTMGSGEARAQAKKPAAAPPKAPPGQNASLKLPKVTQIDGIMLANLLKREGGGGAAAAKPLLVNFWATWCVPCIEEFPDLVKLDQEYRGRLDIITVSLDDLADIETAVPKFLAEMKAEMPAYLLKTADEEAAMNSVSKEWSGALPFTILLNAGGETAYIKQGKFKPDVIRAEIEKVVGSQPSAAISTRSEAVVSQVALQQVENLPSADRFTAEKGKTDAQKDVAVGKLQIKQFGLMPAPLSKQEKSMKKYGVEISSIGCLVPSGFADYARAYNEISIAEIKRKFGDKALEELGIN